MVTAYRTTRKSTSRVINRRALFSSFLSPSSRKFKFYARNRQQLVKPTCATPDVKRGPLVKTHAFLVGLFYIVFFTRFSLFFFFFELVLEELVLGNTGNIGCGEN